MTEPIDASKMWYTVRDLSCLFHRSPKTIRHLIRPYRERCHRDRCGSHPRKVLWIPVSVVREIAEKMQI